jgi:hypothetical protein
MSARPGNRLLLTWEKMAPHGGRVKSRCFRSLLLVACPHLHLTKGIVTNLKPTTISEFRFTRKVLQNEVLHLHHQQSMAEAAFTFSGRCNPGFRLCWISLNPSNRQGADVKQGFFAKGAIVKLPGDLRLRRTVHVVELCSTPLALPDLYFHMIP